MFLLCRLFVDFLCFFKTVDLTTTPPDDVFIKEEHADIEAKAKKEAERQYAKRQAESGDRYSLDEDNKRAYTTRVKE